MLNLTSTCFLYHVTFDQVTKFTLFGFGLANTSYAVVLNIIAFLGTWKIHKRHMTRTAKLLLSLFAINLLVAFAVILLSVYQFMDDFLQSWYFSAHLSTLVFLILWSSTNILLVTVDRYLLVIRGKCYLFWKRNFLVVVVLTTCIILGFSISFYFGLKTCTYQLTVVNLAVFSAILLVNLIVCFVTNIAMMKYVRRNMSCIGSSRPKMKNKVAKTVCAMAISAGLCQVLLVLLLTFFTVSFATESSATKYGNVVVTCFIIIVLFKCGTFPLIYIIRNTRIRRSFSV